MFWRLKTQIPSKQPWNGLLSSYFKVSQISYSILWFLSCIRITPCPSKKTYAGSLWEVLSIGQLIKLFGEEEPTNTHVCVWNVSLGSLYLLNWPDLNHFMALEQPLRWQITNCLQPHHPLAPSHLFLWQFYFDAQWWFLMLDLTSSPKNSLKRSLELKKDPHLLEIPLTPALDFIPSAACLPNPPSISYASQPFFFPKWEAGAHKVEKTELFLLSFHYFTGPCKERSLIAGVISNSTRKRPIYGQASSSQRFLLFRSPSLRINPPFVPPPRDLTWLFRHKHNKSLPVPGCDVRICSME